MDKSIAQMSTDELRAALAAYQKPQIQRGHNGVIVAPPQLNDPTVDPALRGAILEAYAGACMDVPAGRWTAEMREAVREVSKLVISRGF